jgi:signal transduction histidine kinase
MVEKVEVLSKVIANHTTAAILFDDKETLKENLYSLASYKEVKSAVVMDSKDSVLATYGAEMIDIEKLKDFENLIPLFIADNVYFKEAIIVDNESIGLLIMKISLDSLKQQQRQLHLIIFIMISLIIILSYLITLRFEGIISRPIIELTELIKKVEKENNYTLRTAYKSNDEIGLLSNSFNKMLSSIQEKQKLQEDIKQEIEKNRQQQLLMLHQSRLAQMGEMISMIAHQWRQPLNSLAMLSNIVVVKYRRGKLDTKIIDYFNESSNKQIQQMSKTIDDFRDFFKPEKERVDYCINDVIIHSIDMLNVGFSQYNLVLKYENSQKIYSNGFPNELGQALVNIINNAKDALVENEIVDKVIVVYLEEQDNRVILTIRDNAGGIPDDIIDKIFDPYFSTKAEKNGTGLGLYMTKLIIEEHLDGKVSVKNRSDGADILYLYFNLKGKK